MNSRMSSFSRLRLTRLTILPEQVPYGPQGKLNAARYDAPLRGLIDTASDLFRFPRDLRWRLFHGARCQAIRRRSNAYFACPLTFETRRSEPVLNGVPAPFLHLTSSCCPSCRSADNALQCTVMTLRSVASPATAALIVH